MWARPVKQVVSLSTARSMDVQGVSLSVASSMDVQGVSFPWLAVWTIGHAGCILSMASSMDMQGASLSTDSNMSQLCKTIVHGYTKSMYSYFPFDGVSQSWALSLKQDLKVV